MPELREPRRFVYVSGPYTPPEGLSPVQAAKAKQRNVEAATEAGLRLLAKGHIPFVPHTMMAGWQEGSVGRDAVMEVSLRWVERCDALLFLGASDGANQERQHAEKLGLLVFQGINAVPAADEQHPLQISKEALAGYLAEYEQCMESYRHTYQTIWQAGTVILAVSAAVTAFGQLALRLFAPLPLLLWFFGVFLPMNRYGELRNDRLAQIEEILEARVPYLHMSHYRQYSAARKRRSTGWALVWRFLSGAGRVRWYVTTGCLLLLLLQVLLWYRHWVAL